MASKAWTDIPTTDVDSESPLTESLIGDFHDNQESLISAQVDTRFDEISAANGSYPGTRDGAVEIFFPDSVGTLNGDVTLVVRFEVKVDGTVTDGRVQMKIAGGTGVEVTGITSTSYIAQTLTIPAADVRASADSMKDLEIRTMRVGTGNVYVRCVWGSSHFERAA